MNTYYWLPNEPRPNAPCVQYHTILAAQLTPEPGWQSAACRETANFICELGKQINFAVKFCIFTVSLKIDLLLSRIIIHLDAEPSSIVTSVMPDGNVQETSDDDDDDDDGNVVIYGLAGASGFLFLLIVAAAVKRYRKKQEVQREIQIMQELDSFSSYSLGGVESAYSVSSLGQSSDYYF